MPKMKINKSIHITAKPEEVYAKLIDFNHWKAWSPWLIMEKGVNVNVSEDGKYYSWEGKRVGSGNMTVTAEKENHSIDYDLTFLKPFKSRAKVGFEIKSSDGGTDVTWTMVSNWPFFMFWMKKQMEAYIGMDYERGLSMLKDYVEDGKVHSQLEIKGTQNFSGYTYLGIKGEGEFDEMGEDMEGKINKLAEFAKENDVETGEVLSIYHKWDVVNRRAAYTVGIEIKTPPVNLSGELFVGQIPETKVHTVEHKGAYGHLGNAWGLQYMMQRGKEFKLNKKIDPFEVYKNDPAETDKDDLLTNVHFAVKA